ncbi:SelB C-terminal domain-containing protein [Quadrisphaera sp. DSM 44207]|uniref:selenocysteine-specific translation elongation factor n=1 Tax=Quadrisphaera sp. DSM 44207 TaxID=1881057 RepID=UPI000881B3D2|nr:selenocysteine-specific translation elongation factor [Quadrisphaera sp. DSM 44207]SDQ38123.1 selenocysteine-specific elongation factor [Quadrisphaera sp. DSM 44207]
MHVVATAGHVDHGKSTLVRALTGMEPDRYEEERRRGLTIDLGFAWTALPGAAPGEDAEVAFVDVPGHERFVATTLAGVGPVPAVLFVVAADGGWMPQSSEHLDALAALGVSSGLLVVTRCDLADPAAATAAAREHLAGTPLAGVPDVAVSATTGAGVDELRAALLGLVRSLPAPDPAAPVRLWVDRAFTVRGAGTVVTGTLPAGTLRTGDALALPGGRTAVVRGLHQLGRPVGSASAVSRVAVNLRGVPAGSLGRGNALTTPGTAVEAEEVDVLLRRTGRSGPGPSGLGPTGPGPSGLGPGSRAGEVPRLPEQLVLHVGSAAVPVRVRELGPDSARLRLHTPLPLRLGDTGLLRDPGAHRVVAGTTVLDPAPPPLRRRGAARERAAALAGLDGTPDAAGELERRGTVRAGDLVAMGMAPDDAAELVRRAGAAGSGVVTDGEWLLSPAAAARLRTRLQGELAAHERDRPLEPGLPVEAARRRLDLPAASLVPALVAGLAGVAVREGRVVRADRPSGPSLPGPVQASVDAVLADLARAPYAAPEAHRLRELGLGARELGAAVRAGALARVADGVYLSPAAVADAAAPLRALPQPFTLSEARQAWGTSRRVAVPLLELLDARGATRRLPDARREVAS